MTTNKSHKSQLDRYSHFKITDLSCWGGKLGRIPLPLPSRGNIYEQSLVCHPNHCSEPPQPWGSAYCQPLNSFCSFCYSALKSVFYQYWFPLSNLSLSTPKNLLQPPLLLERLKHLSSSRTIKDLKAVTKIDPSTWYSIVGTFLSSPLCNMLYFLLNSPSSV